MFKILIEKNGMAIVANDDNRLYAYYNGNYYNTLNYKPVWTTGRQLREENRNLIKELLPEAKNTLKNIIEEETKKENANREKWIKEHEKELPRVNFADALQDAFLKTLTEKASGEMVENLYPTIEKMLIDKFGILPKVHEIKIPNKAKTEVKGVLHPQFDNILNMVMMNEPIYLIGKAGTGKSYLAQQIAKALNLDYYYTNAVTDDVQIKGFIDANGRYHDTQFYKAFVNGGLFLFDEMDGSCEESLLLINNALANGYFDFPTGRAIAHEDFRCIGAGNTYGTGATLEYTGRARLDAATLNRFAFIEINYSIDIEMAITDGNKELVDFAEDFRKATEKAGVSCLCTYRDIKRLYKFDSFMNKAKNIKSSLTKGLKKDDIAFIVQKMTVNNDWTEALKELSI